MAGVAEHSDYRGDPWGRLQRTSTFLAVTTFGHGGRRATRGRQGARYPSAGPRCGAGRHAVCGVRSPSTGVGAHRRGGQLPARTPALRRGAARPGRAATDTSPTPPVSPRRSACPTHRAPNSNCSNGSPHYRPELRGTASARDAARFLLLTPPLPLVARAPYGVLAATSVAMLPAWARAPLWLPYVPPVEATVIKMAGNAVVGGIRWAMRDRTGRRWKMTRRPEPEKPAPGQESVWDYPRPPRLEEFSGEITVELGGRTIASTKRGWRVLETSHPPTYYLPRESFPTECCARRRARRGANGRGRRATSTWWPTRRSRAAAWTYLTPTAGFEPIAGAVAVMAAAVDRCTVNGERSRPQPGGFYGGWVTSWVRGRSRASPGRWAGSRAR